VRLNRIKKNFDEPLPKELSGIFSQDSDAPGFRMIALSRASAVKARAVIDIDSGPETAHDSFI
jgi:hypothetical protein